MAWPEALDDMEARLAEAAEGLRTGGGAPAPFTLPDNLGPLPASLRDRAAGILERTHALVAEAETARHKMAHVVRPARSAVRQPAAYLDTWA